MQYIMNLGEVFRRQRHIRDGRNRFPIYVPVWAVSASESGYRRRPEVPLQFQCIMSTDVFHEIHPRGPRFPVDGDHGRTTIDIAVQAR